MRLSPDYDSRKAIPFAPEMWLSEIYYIEKMLGKLSRNKKKLNILEWGSGNSTIYFTKLLKQKGIPFNWYAIEHFVPWYKKVITMLEKYDLLGDVTCFLKSPTCEPDKNIQETLDLEEYIYFPTTLGIKFDLIIVDGRKRKECLEAASQILAHNGLVVLHDAEREWYHDGFKHYLDGGTFVTANTTPAAYGGIQKLWVGHAVKDKRRVSIFPGEKTNGERF